MQGRPPMFHLALACLVAGTACRKRDAGTHDSAAASPVAVPAPRDSVTTRDNARVAPPDSLPPRDSARVARAAAEEEDRPCLASRIGLPCAGSDGPP